MKNFKEKVVVVTGAGSGIGRAIAHLFAKKGARLVISDINEERLSQVKREIEGFGAVVGAKAADVSCLDDVKSLALFAKETFGGVDILVNNAGIGWGGPIELFPIEDFERVMAVNFWGVVYGVFCFLPMLKTRQEAHIVNIASSAGLNGAAMLGAYSASKHAVAGYTEVLRAEMRRYNIGVTAICPGIINTNIVKDGKAVLPEKAKSAHDRMVAFYKKWGWPPKRVARAVLKAVKKNRGVVPVGPEAWLMWYCKRLSQRLWELFLARVAGPSKRKGRKKKAA